MSYPIINHINCTNFSEKHQNFLATITKIVEPVFYDEAAKDPHWRDAMREEIRALEKNETWTLETPPSGKKAYRL